jgi:Arc/MetJ-type ribon-helix-helix transcriptional regulator
MRTISVRLDDASEATLEHLCQALGLSQTDVVKAGLDLLQGQRQTPEALARSLGLVGCFAQDAQVAPAEPVPRARQHSRALKEKLRQREQRQRPMSSP